jgi:hypothetical protein
VTTLRTTEAATLAIGAGLAAAAVAAPWRPDVTLAGATATSGPGSGVVAVVLLAPAAVALLAVWLTWARPRPSARTPLACSALVAGLAAAAAVLLAPNSDGLTRDGTGAGGPWLALAGALLAGATGVAVLLPARD